MATTTKKSTTRKKPTASKTSSAKTTKKTTSKKVVKAPVKTTAKVTAPAVTAKKDTPVKAAKTPPTKMQKLFQWNAVLAALYALMAVAVVALTKAGQGIYPVTTNYNTVDTLATTENNTILVSATRHLFDIHLSWLVAAFLLIAAITHLVVATKYRKTYEANLEKGINKARWISYSLTVSTMMVVIGFLVGIFDISTILAVFALTAIVCLSGLLYGLIKQENGTSNPVTRKIGFISGVLPWAIFLIYIWGAYKYSEAGSPQSFVYWILASMAVMLGAHGFIERKQSSATGKWSDNVYVEKAYMVVGFIAATALAAQVYLAVLKS